MYKIFKAKELIIINSIVDFSEESRADRMLLLQEAILARFGFLPCVIEKKFSFNKDVSTFCELVYHESLIELFLFRFQRNTNMYIALATCLL